MVSQRMEGRFKQLFFLFEAILQDDYKNNLQVPEGKKQNINDEKQKCTSPYVTVPQG